MDCAVEWMDVTERGRRRKRYNHYTHMLLSEMFVLVLPPAIGNNTVRYVATIEENYMVIVIGRWMRR